MRSVRYPIYDDYNPYASSKNIDRIWYDIVVTERRGLNNVNNNTIGSFIRYTSLSTTI